MSLLPAWVRRPSPATVLAAVALFVALGGPAKAAQLLNGKQIKPNSVTTKQIKDFSIGERDLNKSLVNRLASVGANSVNGSSVADGSLGTADLAPGSVDGSRLAAGAVGATNVADGSLGASDLGANAVETGTIRDGSLRGVDVGRFTGTLELPFSPIPVGKCGSSTSTSLTGTAASEDLHDDAIVVTPNAGFPTTAVVGAAPAGANQITVTICNLGAAELAAGNKKFTYVSIDAVGN
jgi:hypothetical protein